MSNSLLTSAIRSRWCRLLPLVLLGLCVFASHWTADAIAGASHRKAEEAYRMRTQEIVARISSELEGHEHLLLGAIGLFDATASLNEEHWRQYTSAIQPHLTRRGTGGMGFAAWTDTTAGPRALIRYFAPLTSESRQLFGRDLGSSLSVREAMQRAMVRGSPEIVPNLTTESGRPVGSGDYDEHRSLVMLAPIYRRGTLTDSPAGHQCVLNGFVFTTVQIQDLIGGLFPRSASDVAFEIFDSQNGGSGLRLYSSVRRDEWQTALDRHPAFTSSRSINAYGRTWTISFRTLPGFHEGLKATHVSLIRNGGLFIGVLLAVVAWLLLSEGKQAIVLASRMTRDLQESETRFRTIADASPVLMWLNDPCGFRLWSNRAWLEFTGRKSEEELGRGWLEGIHPSDLSVLLQAINQLLETHQQYQGEYLLRRADGAYRKMLACGVPRLADDGSFLGYSGSAIDITEIREANETACRAEEFARATLDALQANICVLDEQGVVLAVNQSWRDFALANPPAPEGFGLGSNYLDVCDRAGAEGDLDAYEVAAGIRAVISGERDAYLLEYRCDSPRQRRFFQARVTRFDSPGPQRVVISHADITARRLAEEALREREEQLNAAQRQAHVGSWTRYLESGRVVWSEEMYRIVGRKQGPILLTSEVTSMYTEESLARLEEALREAQRTGEAFNLELELVRSDGIHRLCEMKGEARRNEQGHIDRLHGTFHDVTEQRALGRELRESHDLLRSLTGQMPAVIYQYRIFPDGRRSVPYASRGLEEMFELKPEDVRDDATTLLRRFHPDDLPAVQARFRQSAETLLPWKQEFRVLLPAQGERWREGLAHPQRLEDGSTLWHGYITDVTDRKALEGQLRLARFTVDNLTDGVYWLLPDGRFWNVNAAACRMVGYSHEELTARSVHDLDPGLTTQAWLDLWAKLKLAGTVRLQTVQRRKDGRDVPVEVTLNCLNFDGLEYAWALVRDITEQIHAERVKERRQRAILDNLPMQAWLKDADGRFAMVNEAFAESCGRPPYEIIGKRPCEVLPLQEARICESINQEARSARQQRGAEVSLSTPEGTKWRLVQAMPLFDEQGKVVGTTGISQDISDRKRYEQELLQAREAADAASRAKSGFLANMSHEIRTPMNGVLGMNQLLLDTALDPHQRRCADVLRDSATSLLEVLDEILDWSKVEAGKLVLEKFDFDLRPLIESITDLFAARAQQKGLGMLCFIAPDAPTALRGDPVRLRQILLNLVGNAVKFTGEGEVSLWVKLERDGESPLLRFEVSDSGIGIAKEKLHLLFQPFSQADSSTTRHFGGTGLGLSIVDRLVKLMDGEVSCESEEGRGSTFWFTARFDRQPGVVRPRPLSLTGRRVLLIDGNGASRRFLCDLLSYWSCDFKAVSNVENAIRCLTTIKPDGLPFEAVIADPASLGLEIDDMIRLFRVSSIPETSIIELVPLASVANGAAPHPVTRIAKPVKQGELGNCLATVLGYGPAPGFAMSKGSEEKIAPPAASRQARTGRRLLLVEDNATNQEVAIAILNTLGYQHIEVANNGVEALALLREAIFDIILMDCQMPEMDGYEATRAIRNPETPVRQHDIPILAMTAHNSEADRRKCLEAGMDDYLPKPIRRDRLELRLEALLEGRAPTAAAPAPLALSLPGPVAAPGAPVFDREDLLSRVMGNSDLARRVVSRFLLDMPQQLAALSAALGSSDSKTARLAAHSIKGAAANVGGTQLRQTARIMEEFGEAGKIEEGLQLLGALNGDWERFRAESRAFVEKR